MFAAKALSAGVFLLGWSAALGCVDERSASGNRPSPCIGASCTPGGGIGMGSGGGGGEGGSSQGESVTGSVVVANNDTFSTFDTYGGAVSILAPALGGGTLTALYGGQNGSSFTLDGVQGGSPWLLARDEELGGTGVLSTYTRVTLPSALPLTLPMLDSSILTTIATNAGAFVDPIFAQVVLRVRRNGAALPGVAVSSADSDFILFDAGPGAFSMETNVTGASGLILLLNVPNSAGGMVELTLQDKDGTTYKRTVPVLIGGATLADLTL